MTERRMRGYVTKKEKKNERTTNPTRTMPRLMSNSQLKSVEMDGFCSWLPQETAVGVPLYPPSEGESDMLDVLDHQRGVSFIADEAIFGKPSTAELEFGCLVQIAEVDIGPWSPLTLRSHARELPKEINSTENQLERAADCLTVSSFSSDWMLWDKNGLDM